MQNNTSDMHNIGAIMDITSRAGKEARVAMEIAIHDFNTKMKKNLTLFTRNSNGNLVQAIRE
nr:glutamate receptor 2.8-like [Tanacetum cinerariifolium]